MKKLVVLLGVISVLITTPLFAGSASNIGLKVDIEASGFFKPTIESAKVAEVVAGSPADSAGVLVGDSIVAIDGCAIPGCPAKKAKAAMSKTNGQVIELDVKNVKQELRSVSIVTQ